MKMKVRCEGGKIKERREEEWMFKLLELSY